MDDLFIRDKGCYTGDEMGYQGVGIGSIEHIVRMAGAVLIEFVSK